MVICWRAFIRLVLAVVGCRLSLSGPYLLAAFGGCIGMLVGG